MRGGRRRSGLRGAGVVVPRSCGFISAIIEGDGKGIGDPFEYALTIDCRVFGDDPSLFRHALFILRTKEAGSCTVNFGYGGSYFTGSL